MYCFWIQLWWSEEIGKKIFDGKKRSRESFGKWLKKWITHIFQINEEELIACEVSRY
jgi:Fe-S cluster biosynthesis and repair protein YggX